MNPAIKSTNTGPAADEQTSPGWTFLTNHGHVLLCLAAEGDLTIRQLAHRVGITERATQSIISDLIDGGYLTRTRVGRRNTYTVNPNGPLRHPLEAHHNVGTLIHALR
ncbi:helix-turn-helix transcriptional regulator [Actinopolyspora mzabensis]|nr:winged helix-turn-helix domain-containing protein [Actinopolyspora mzabensis]